MSLDIYYSDKIEDLAAHLKMRLLSRRKTADPFVCDEVVVPNTNIAKWLGIKAFRDAPSLCMGVQFPFIEQALFSLLNACIKDPKKRAEPLPSHAYAHGILSILQKSQSPNLAPFRKYVNGGDDRALDTGNAKGARMAWQLAIKLAALMDTYEAHRRGIIAHWLDHLRLDGKAPPLPGGIEAAQAELAAALFSEDGLYPPQGRQLSLRQLFEKVKSARETYAGEKRTIDFFGLSTLTSLQVEILVWLAQYHDVTLYHNNVCFEYWGDIQTLSGGMPQEDDPSVESTLLRRWGRAGRETLSLLVDAEEQKASWNPLPSAARACGTMLEKVQASVRQRKDETTRVGKQDASIQIVAAPGIRREVEMVYNAVLGAVWQPKDSGTRPWSACSFSDIAILVPDMKTYRPVIESVFDGRGEVPYGLIDTTAGAYSHYLQGFMALMDVARHGLSRDRIFAVLDNPCVQRAFSFTDEHVRAWRRCTKEIGAFEGFAEKSDFANHDWDRALSRMRLGRVAKPAEDVCVWEGDTPDALVFSEIVETLQRELVPLKKRRMVCATAQEEGKAPNWEDTLRRIAGVFLALDAKENLEENVRRQIFQTLHALEKTEGAQSLDFVAEAIAAFTDGIKCQKGGYLTNGVTVAALQPMRPVPFKQVFVLGMGAGSFPGHDRESTLEIRGAVRTLGDVQPVAWKKHLFLETVMATRERLVLSYNQYDIVKDAELFPSSVLCELKQYLEAHVLPEGHAFKEVKLPLLEWAEADDFRHEKKQDNILARPAGPVVWRKDEYYAGILTTYSNAARRMARGQVRARAAEGQRTEANAETPPAEITSKTLADFLLSPLRTVLNRLHGIGINGYSDDALDPDVPLEAPGKGPVAWELDRALVCALPENPQRADIERVYRSFADHGQLPDTANPFGACALERIKERIAKRPEDWGILKRFTVSFLADGEKAGKVCRLHETGKQTYVHVANAGDACDFPLMRRRAALVYKPCGDERKAKGTTYTRYPPKAVLEPLLAWMVKIAGETEPHAWTLDVGVVDLEQALYNVWRWRMTPAEASTFLENASLRYLAYLDEIGDDGVYLDWGYEDLVDAFARAEKGGLDIGEFLGGKDAAGGAARMEEGWAYLAAHFKDGEKWRAQGKFDNSLVLEKSLEWMGRKPGPCDREKIRSAYDDLFRIPLSGMRQEV